LLLLLLLLLLWLPLPLLPWLRLLLLLKLSHLAKCQHLPPQLHSIVGQFLDVVSELPELFRRGQISAFDDDVIAGMRMRMMLARVAVFGSRDLLVAAASSFAGTPQACVVLVANVPTLK